MIIGLFPSIIVAIFLMVSILFSAISTNFQPLLAKVNSEKGQSRKICSDVYDAPLLNDNVIANEIPKSANNSVMMHIDKVFDECLGVEFYSVKGSSLKELGDQLKFKEENGRNAGQTKASVSYHLNLNKNGLVDGSSTI
jgi:hypothetical protein